jgi:hypothetical protein
VSEDSAEITEARRLARLAPRRELQRLRDGKPLSLYYPPFMHAVERYPARTIAALEEVLTRPGDSDESLDLEAAAVVLLWHLGAVNARKVLADRLSAGPPAMTVRLVRELTSLALWCRARTKARTSEQPSTPRIPIRFRASDIADPIATCLEAQNVDVLQAIAHLAMFVSVPGISEQALVLVRTTDRRGTEHLLSIAVRNIRTSEILAITSRALDHADNEPERRVLLGVLNTLLHDTDPAIVQEAAHSLQRFIARFGPDHPETQFPQQTLDPWPGTLEAASALGNPQEARQALLHMARTAGPNGARRAVEALGVLAAGSEDDTLVEQIVECQMRRPADYLGVQTALLHIRGRLADGKLGDSLLSLGSQRRAEILWALEGWTLPDILMRAQVAGVIPQRPSLVEISAVVREHCGGSPDSAFSLFSPLVTMLNRYGAAVKIRREHRWYPPRYDYLVGALTTIAEPWLKIRNLSEVVHSGADCERWGYTIRFTANGRAYRLEMPHTTKYYWVQPVIDMLNRVLEDNGTRERFFPFDEEQEVLFFGVPGQLRQLSHAIMLPMTGEPRIAEDAAVEYLVRRQKRKIGPVDALKD